MRTPSPPLRRRPVRHAAAPARLPASEPVSPLDALAEAGRRAARSGDLDAAVASFSQALALAPDRVDGLSNLGAVALRQGRPREAERWLSRALQADPDFADARYNRGLARLLAGDPAGGFADYRARWDAWGLARPFPDSPPWTGTPLRRPLLLHTEQGLGDALHFVRYVPAAAARAGSVILACQPPLGALLAGVPGLSGLLPLGAAPPPHDAALALLDLPDVLGVDAPNQAPVPYLAAPEERLAPWRATLEALAPGQRRVGIAWRGSPTHALDRERSIPAAALAPLARIPGVRLVALHPDPSAAEHATLAPLGVLFPPPDPDWRRDAFLGTAALMQALDLVISVDTSFLHLAGALGRPAWLLLPPVPDWRWGLQGETTPWYPTVRLVRRPGPAWEPVVDLVARRLASRFGQRTAPSGSLPP